MLKILIPPVIAMVTLVGCQTAGPQHSASFATRHYSLSEEAMNDAVRRGEGA